MRIRCAWHQPPKIMGEQEPLEDDGITDGICDSCLSKYFPTIADKIAKLNIIEQERYPDFKIEEVK